MEIKIDRATMNYSNMAVTSSVVRDDEPGIVDASLRQIPMEVLPRMVSGMEFEIEQIRETIVYLQNETNYRAKMTGGDYGHNERRLMFEQDQRTIRYYNDLIISIKNVANRLRDAMENSVSSVDDYTDHDFDRMYRLNIISPPWYYNINRYLKYLDTCFNYEGAMVLWGNHIPSVCLHSLVCFLDHDSAARVFHMSVGVVTGNIMGDPFVLHSSKVLCVKPSFHDSKKYAFGTTQNFIIEHKESPTYDKKRTFDQQDVFICDWGKITQIMYDCFLLSNLPTEELRQEIMTGALKKYPADLSLPGLFGNKWEHYKSNLGSLSKYLESRMVKWKKGQPENKSLFKDERDHGK